MKVNHYENPSRYSHGYDRNLKEIIRYCLCSDWRPFRFLIFCYTKRKENLWSSLKDLVVFIQILIQLKNGSHISASVAIIWC